MTEGNTTTPGGVGDDADLAGLPFVPPGAEVLAVVSVALLRDATGIEWTSVSAVNADGDDLPITTALGILVLGMSDLTD